MQGWDVKVRKSSRNHINGFVTAVMLLLFAIHICACGAEPPPLEELSLRDALQADPEVIAQLPAAARMQLAVRFEEESHTEREAVIMAGGADDWANWPEEQTRDADAMLLEQDEDAMVLAIVYTDEQDGELTSFRAEPLDAQPERTLPAIEGERAGDTEAMESAAVDGLAGTRLQALLTHSGAERLERVIGWPVGAVAIEDRLYVNAAWLVALSPAETPLPAQTVPWRAVSQRTAVQPPPEEQRQAPKAELDADHNQPAAATSILVTTWLVLNADNGSCQSDCDNPNSCDDSSCEQPDSCDGDSCTHNSGGCDCGSSGGNSNSCGNDRSCSIHGRRRIGFAWLWLLAPVGCAFIEGRRA